MTKKDYNIKTGDDNADRALLDLVEAIENQDLETSKYKLGFLYQLCMNNQPLAKWIVQPSNLFFIHEKIEKQFGLPQKTMRLARRIPHTQKRAVMFFKAMINALERIS